MCRIEGADPATVYRESYPTARKVHRCEECRRVIEPGERYRYVFSVYEGHGNSYYTCGHCCAGQDWLGRECGGYIFGEVAEELREHAEEYPELAVPLLRLYAGIRRGWRWFNREMMRPPAVPAVTIRAAVYGR
jgi:hypothetical protein